jgi:hypothetical protein
MGQIAQKSEKNRVVICQFALYLVGYARAKFAGDESRLELRYLYFFNGS